MSKTKSPSLTLIACVAAMVFSCGTAAAQTIDELAAMQRTKLQEEIRKSKGLPDAEQLAAVKSKSLERPAPLPPARSGLTVHALYTKGNGAQLAELTDGTSLMMATPGRRFGPFRIVSVGEQGVTVTPAVCKSKKKCDPDKVVRVGGSF